LCSGFCYAQRGWVQVESGVTENLKSIGVVYPSTAVAVGQSGVILRTTDWGTSWNAQYLPEAPDLNTISFSENNHIYGVIAGSLGNILRTHNSGASWDTIRTGWFINYLGAYQLTQQIGAVVGQNTVLQPFITETLNGWTSTEDHNFYLMHDNVSTEGMLHDIYFWNGLIIFGAAESWDNQGAIVKSTDGGSNWETIYWANSPLRAMDFVSNNVAYIVGDNGLILKTTDIGVTWNQLTEPLRVNYYDVDFVTPNTGWVVGENATILRTDDGAASWIPQQSEPNVVYSSVRFYDSDTGYVVGENGTILRTFNGGWEENVGPLPFHRVLPADHDTLLVSWPHDSITFSWTRAIDPDNDPVTYILYLISEIPYIPDADTVVLTDTTYSVRLPLPVLNSLDMYMPFVWRVVASDGEFSIEASNGSGEFTVYWEWEHAEDPNASLPQTYRLTCYPNPFNPVTTISFALPKQGDTDLKVFNLTGQTVLDRSYGMLAAGKHEISFDGKNLSSGVYIVRLQSGTSLLSRKIMLLK
jgi:photosystem II stability/assembly factor-like uncharacterized protein